MSKYLIILCLVVVSCFARAPNRIIDPSSNWRIVGGADAPDGAHPHQVSLRMFGSHSCGGSIVNNEWIITAAHCVAGMLPIYYQVVVGSNQLNSGGRRYAVREIKYHENYDSWNIQNDVAIIRVKPIEYSRKVSPIAAESEYVGGGENVTLSGWGTTSYPGSAPNNLQQIELKTLSVEECQSRAEALPVVASEICTLTAAGEGACHGDSGGPLTRNVNGRRSLVGIVSWGQPCAKGYPDVFSRVSSFRDWFNEKCNNCL